MTDERFAPGRRERYLGGGLRRVEGWLDGFSARAIDALARRQHDLGLTGGVGEIGVHHGKFFLLLYLATTAPEKACAIDIFEQQELNPDASGRGDRERFLANLDRHAGTREGVAIIARSSLEIAPEEILEACGPTRLFSVDGGHTDDCTLNDLRLAEAVSTPHGIVVLDDFFNQPWPGVASGAARYLLDPATALRPFAILPNKLLLARPDWHRRYAEALAAAFPRRLDKTAVMFGSEVLLLGTREPGLRRLIAYSPFAETARRLRDRLQGRRSSA